MIMAIQHLLEVQDFWDRLENLIQRALVGSLPVKGGGGPLSIGFETLPSNIADTSD